MKDIIIFAAVFHLIMINFKVINKSLLKISYGGFIAGSIISLTNLYLIITKSDYIDRTFIWGLDRTFLSDIMISLIPFSIFMLLNWQIPKHTVQKFKNYKFIIFTIILISQCINLLILRTRSAWVSLTIILFVSIWISWKYYNFKSSIKKFLIVISGIILISITISAFINLSKENDRQSLYHTIISIGQIKDASNQARFSFWGASLYMFKDSPFTGIGRGKWAGLYPLYIGVSYTDENVDTISAINPHNDYLEILSEYGIFGFLLFTGFIFTGLYLLFKKSTKKIIYLPFFLSAIGICVTMFFSFTKDNFWTMFVFSVCMGVGFSHNSELRIMNYKFLRILNNKRFFRTLIFIFGLLILSVGVWFKFMSYLNERMYLEAMQLKAQGKYAEMLEKLDKVTYFYYPVDMNKMPVDYYRGIGYFELKQYDKALERFRNARKYMKYYPTIMNNEASALYMMRKIKEAEVLYLEIKKMFPYYIEPQINLLALYANNNRIDDLMKLGSDIKTKIQKVNRINNYALFKEIDYKYGF